MKGHALLTIAGVGVVAASGHNLITHLIKALNHSTFEFPLIFMRPESGYSELRLRNHCKLKEINDNHVKIVSKRYIKL